MIHAWVEVVDVVIVDDVCHVLSRLVTLWWHIELSWHLWRLD